MKFKKTVGAMMAAAMTFCGISLHALALEDDSWFYERMDNQITITGYKGSSQNIVIPDELLGTPVTKVEGEGIFKKQTAVTFPNTVKTIGNVFKGAAALRTVNIPEGVENIEADAFNGCKSLKNITLPSTIKSIGDRAFANCIGVTSVTIPSGLQYGWDDSAFQGSGVTNLDFSGLTNLVSGTMSCKDCKSLTSVTMAPGITSIPEGMFYGCSSIEKIEFPADSRISVIPKQAFYNCMRLKNVNIPVSVVKIDSDAFTNCDALSEIIIPYGVVQVGAAFQSCDSLESIYIPDSVTEIDKNMIKDSKKAVIFCSDYSPALDMFKEYGMSHQTDSSVNSGITVLYNGRRVSFQAYEQNPDIIMDNTMVPLRAIFEAMNASVVWNDATNTVLSTRGTTRISMTIGSKVMYKNDVPIELEVPAQLINDRTMVPVRAIAESFGATVEWDDAAKTVSITE